MTKDKINQRVRRTVRFSHLPSESTLRVSVVVLVHFLVVNGLLFCSYRLAKGTAAATPFLEPGSRVAFEEIDLHAV